MSKRVKDATIIKLLRLIREQIAGGGTVYVCIAADEVAVYHKGFKEARNYVQHWVDSMLGKDNATLEHWLINDNHVVRGKGLNGHWDINNPKSRTTRLAWVDWMIAEVERTS